MYILLDGHEKKFTIRFGIRSDSEHAYVEGSMGLWVVGVVGVVGVEGVVGRGGRGSWGLWVVGVEGVEGVLEQLPLSLW